MLHKRLLAAATATFLALGMAVGGASPAMAAGNPTNTNDPVNWQTEEGEVCFKPAFSTEDSANDPFTLPANTEGYVFSKVIIKAGSTGQSVTNENEVYTEDADGGTLTEGDEFVHSEKGSISHVIYCEVPTPDEPGVATASIDLTDPTCELGASLNEAGFGGDNSGYVIVDDGSEDGTYEVVFTADEGYEFEGGLTEITLDGTLEGPDETQCVEPGVATASIDLTDPDCFSGELLNEDGFGGENSSFVVVDDGSEDGTFEVVFTADEGYEFEGGLTELTLDGTLAGPLEGDECTLGLAQAWLEFSAATCLDPEVVETPGEAQLENAAVKSFTVNEVTGEFTVVFELADGGDAFDTNQTDFVYGDYAKDVVASYNEDNTELTLSGTLATADEDLCSEETVTMTAPTAENTCDVQSFTITEVEGVEFTVTVNDGEPVVVDFDGESSVTYDANTFDTVVVVATALDGYAFQEGATTEWTFEYPFPEDCIPTFPATTASVTWTQADCLGNPGSFTLTNEPGVIWEVDGVIVEGNSTYTSAVGTTPTIEASLEGPSEEFPGGFGWSDEDQQTVWNLSFTAADDCLPTLAITGASNALGGLGMVAVLIMMAGTGLVVARRREMARVQG